MTRIASRCFVVIGLIIGLVFLLSPLAYAGIGDMKQVEALVVENPLFSDSAPDPYESGDVDWGSSAGSFKDAADYTTVSGSNGRDRDVEASGFFDWFTDLFDWFDDAQDELDDYLNDPYDDGGISSDPFDPNRYGMNIHNVDQLSVDQYERSLSYAGEWIRIDMTTDEVADGNWGYRLKKGMDRIHEAGDNLGIDPKVIINMSGYSSHSSGEDYLLRDLSWDEKASRYGDLAYELTAVVHSWGYTDTIFESWNEPDNTASGMGIGLSPDNAEFLDSLAKLNNAFKDSVKRHNGITAFSPFMSFNDSKFETLKSAWNRSHNGYDYFSVHMYDDEPGKVRYWAEQVSDILADRPVIVSEHGLRDHKKDFTEYRRQAWAFSQGFSHGGESTLAGVMNYVYGSGDSDWVIHDDEDFFWQVTHHSRP